MVLINNTNIRVNTNGVTDINIVDSSYKEISIKPAEQRH